jgi:hypothetical protein
MNAITGPFSLVPISFFFWNIATLADKVPVVRAWMVVPLFVLGAVYLK